MAAPLEALDSLEELSTPQPPPDVPPPPPSAAYLLVKQAILDAINGNITALNVAVVVTAGIDVLAKQSKLTGPEKKTLLLEVLEAVLVEQGMDEVERTQVMFIVPSFIDKLVYAAKHGKTGGCCVLI